jgi:3-phenylpropionate/trans-cinnamate dioxygenase ferredoxin component
VEATYQKLCDVNDLEDNQTLEVEINGKSVLVTRIDGDFFAIENNCTHENLPLTGGQVYQGQIQCPRHGGRFEVKTGRATQLPAVMDLKTYKIKIEDYDVMAAL